MGLGYGKVVDTECVMCWIKGRFRVEVDVNEKSSHGELSIVEKKNILWYITSVDMLSEDCLILVSFVVASLKWEYRHRLNVGPQVRAAIS